MVMWFLVPSSTLQGLTDNIDISLYLWLTSFFFLFLIFCPAIYNATAMCLRHNAVLNTWFVFYSNALDFQHKACTSGLCLTYGSNPWPFNSELSKHGLYKWSHSRPCTWLCPHKPLIYTCRGTHGDIILVDKCLNEILTRAKEYFIICAWWSFKK